MLAFLQSYYDRQGPNKGFILSMMLWLILLILQTPTALAQDSVYEPVVRRHQQKVKSRWSLEDWFSLKKKRQAQDQWLSWNRKRGPFFELLVDVHGGGHDFKRDGTDADKEDFVVAGGGVQIFFGPAGIGIGRDQYKIKEKEQYSQRDEGSLFLRLAGSSTQTTHLTLLGGVMKYEHKYYGDYDHKFYGVLSNLYIFRHMGLEGQYRVKASADSQTHEIEGEDYHWGAFWELSILRVYLLYHQDFSRAKRISTGVKDNERVNGTVFGARLYF
jgi:hypothetical protein